MIRDTRCMMCCRRSLTMMILMLRWVCYSLLYLEPCVYLLLVAAFEVYVRRGYRAYSLLSIDYEEGDGEYDGDEPTVLKWRFNLGKSHSPPSTPRFG